MNHSALTLLIWSIVLILAQALVFNHVCLFGVAVPLVFVYILVKLPITMPKEWLFTTAYVVGLIIDIFSDTLGMNALACTLTIAVRRQVIRMYVARDEELPDPYPGLKSFGTFTFVKYVLTFTLLYCVLIFSIESFSAHNLTQLILRIIFSILLTSMLILGIDCLTVRKSEKRL